MNKPMTPAQFKKAHDTTMRYVVTALRESAALRTALAPRGLACEGMKNEISKATEGQAMNKRTTVETMMVVLAYTDMTGLRQTGRMVQRDLNWFPEMETVEEPKACVWLRRGTQADLAKASAHMDRDHADKIRRAVYALPVNHRDPLGEAKRRIMTQANTTEAN